MSRPWAATMSSRWRRSRASRSSARDTGWVRSSVYSLHSVLITSRRSTWRLVRRNAASTWSESRFVATSSRAFGFITRTSSRSAPSRSKWSSSKGRSWTTPRYRLTRSVRSGRPPRRIVCSRDVDFVRVEANPGDLIRLDDPDQMFGVAASCVEDHAAGLKILRREFVEPVGAIRGHAYVEALVHVPRRRAIHTGAGRDCAAPRPHLVPSPATRPRPNIAFGYPDADHSRTPDIWCYRTSVGAVAYATGFFVAGPNRSPATSSTPVVSIPRPRIAMPSRSARGRLRAFGPPAESQRAIQPAFDDASSRDYPGGRFRTLRRAARSVRWSPSRLTRR